MPTSYLSDIQSNCFGRFDGASSRENLAKYFILDP